MNADKKQIPLARDRIAPARLSCQHSCIVSPSKENKRAGVTVKVDDGLPAKARLPAAQRNTSINAIVKQKLEDFVATDLRREATLLGLEETPVK